MFSPSLTYLVLVSLCNKSVFSKPPSITSDKAIVVDWATKMWLGGDISRYLGGSTKKMPILKQRERHFDGDTGLSLLLPASCPANECDEATCSVEAPTAGQRNVFLLAKREDSEWEVKCALFDDVELPALYTQLPEARNLDGDDRTRGFTAAQPQQQKSSSTPTVKKTISIQGFGSDPEPAGLVVDSHNQGPVQASVDCEELFSSNAEKFFSDCCMRTGAAESDSRCVLKTLLQVMENQQKTDKAPTTTVRTTTKKISDGFGVTESDIYEEEELDASNTTATAVPADELFSPSESEKIVWSLTGQISTWRGKYFTVLGFFLVFLVIFLLIIAALIYKLRVAKDASPPSSPGAGSGCGGTSPGGDRAPLTPATQQAQTFQYQ